MLILVALLLQLTTTPSQLRRVWDADRPENFQVQLPVRVQTNGFGDARIIAPDGSHVEALDLCGPPQGTGDWRLWIGESSESSGGCGTAYFSRDGSIAVLCNLSVRDPLVFVRRLGIGRIFSSWVSSIPRFPKGRTTWFPSKQRCNRAHG